MDKVDKECLMIRMSVSGCMFLLVLAHPGSPVQRAVKRLCVCVCVSLQYRINAENFVDSVEMLSVL